MMAASCFQCTYCEDVKGPWFHGRMKGAGKDPSGNVESRGLHANEPALCQVTQKRLLYRAEFPAYSLVLELTLQTLQLVHL